MKVVLSGRGSRGDVNPIIEIAAELKRRGNKVKLCVPEYFKEYAETRGLEVPITYSEDTLTLMKGFGSGWTSMKRALDWFSNSITEQFDYLLREAKDADAIITTAAELAGPTVAEHLKIPYVRIAYAPILPGDQPPPLSKWQGLPPWGNKIMWKAVNGATGIFIKRFVNKKRKYLKMKGMGEVGDYFAKDSHNMLAINSNLAPPSELWTKYKYSYSGYCYGDIYGKLDDELLEFINKGDKPIFIGFGSVTVKGPDKFTRKIIEAAKKADCRLVMAIGWAGLGTTKLPDYVCPVKATQHGSLFPLMAATIHHGGSGTTHTSAKSGVPQLVMPQLVDQYYWGNRVYKLGLGPRPVSSTKISVNELANTLKELKSKSAYSINAKRLAEDMKSENGILNIAEYITGLGPSKGQIKDFQVDEARL